MEVAKSTSILQKYASLPLETEWVEYKHSFNLSKEIDERIYAMVTSAPLLAEYQNIMFYIPYYWDR